MAVLVGPAIVVNRQVFSLAISLACVCDLCSVSLQEQDQKPMPIQRRLKLRLGEEFVAVVTSLALQFCVGREIYYSNLPSTEPAGVFMLILHVPASP